MSRGRRRHFDQMMRATCTALSTLYEPPTDPLTQNRPVSTSGGRGLAHVVSCASGMGKSGTDTGWQCLAQLPLCVSSVQLTDNSRFSGCGRGSQSSGAVSRHVPASFLCVPALFLIPGEPEV
eukprot:218254-Rhodomonas_salina.2